MKVDTEFVERVEARLGMGHGAWDHLKPEDICEAVLVEARSILTRPSRCWDDDPVIGPIIREIYSQPE